MSRALCASFALLAFSSGCRSNFEEECNPGTEGCVCEMNEQCLAGLECISNICVAADDDDSAGSSEAGSDSSSSGNETTSETSGDTTGSEDATSAGDGDGDSTTTEASTGDGDSSGDGDGDSVGDGDSAGDGDSVGDGDSAGDGDGDGEPDMIAIEGGGFTDDHTIGPNVFHTIDNLLVDRTEVTVEAYAQCVLDQDCTAPDSGGDCNWEVAGREQHPINCVDLEQAASFCAAQDKRLPTQWEWEWAARGRFDMRIYPWGYIDEPATCEFAVMDDSVLGTGCGDASTAPVGSKPAGYSAQGLVDMSGNVAEIADSDHVLSGFKVSRGGHWGSGAGSTQSLFRTNTSTTYTATARDPGVGFRCVRDAP